MKYKKKNKTKQNMTSNSDQLAFILNATESGSYRHNNDTTIQFEYNLWQKIVFSSFMFPIIIFSVLGNILVVVAICKYSYLRITNNIFLASLALADCAVGILGKLTFTISTHSYSVKPNFNMHLKQCPLTPFNC